MGLPAGPLSHKGGGARFHANPEAMGAGASVKHSAATVSAEIERLRERELNLMVNNYPEIYTTTYMPTRDT